MQMPLLITGPAHLLPFVQLYTADEGNVDTHVAVHCTAVIAEVDAIGHARPSGIAGWTVKADLRQQRCKIALSYETLHNI